MSNTTTPLAVGTRVRCVKGGTGFPGLLGTITEYENYSNIKVEWDNPPAYEVNPTGPNHGGTWSEAHLEVFDEATSLREELREAHSIMAEAAGRLQRAEEIEEGLRDRLTEMARALEEMTYERDAAASVLLYSFEFLESGDCQRVFGFWDAVVA